MEVSKEIVMMPINKIKPYIRNPRKNDKTVKLLVDIIPKVGFNVPLVIDKNGIIVKGHSRFAAGIKLGMTELPCIITNADEETIKLDRLADNKVSEFSEWVNDDLLHELDSLNIDFDLSDFNFPMPSLPEMPDFDDFEDEQGNYSEEDRKAKFEAFLKQQEQSGAPKEVITTQADIDKAVKAHHEVPDKPTKYYKCVCEKCGHTMFVKADEVIELEE